MSKGSCFLRSLILLLSFFATVSQAEQNKLATFSGGSFWFLQPTFDAIPGVIKTEVGYAGGREVSPTYEDVALGETGHLESIQITYDPSKISYEKLLNVYWHNIDPTDPNGQFCDLGEQYRSVIFFHDKTQDELAQKSKEALLKEQKVKGVYTMIRPFTSFYPAEAEHQMYYKKHPLRYRYYKYSCGREKRLKELWGS